MTKKKAPLRVDKLSDQPIDFARSEQKVWACSFTPLRHQQYLRHLLHGNAGREPGERGRGRRRAGSKTVCCWVMNPQVRALTETSGNGRVLRRGKNTGGARKLRHVLTIERLGHAPRFPPSS
jgi:hypothetical protein